MTGRQLLPPSFQVFFFLSIDSVLEQSMPRSTSNESETSCDTSPLDPLLSSLIFSFFLSRPPPQRPHHERTASPRGHSPPCLPYPRARPRPPQTPGAAPSPSRERERERERRERGGRRRRRPLVDGRCRRSSSCSLTRRCGRIDADDIDDDEDHGDHDDAKLFLRPRCLDLFAAAPLHPTLHPRVSASRGKKRKQ